MRKIILILYSCIFSLNILSAQQKFDVNWLFGYSKGYGTQIKFDNDTFKIFDNNKKLPMDLTSSIYSDEKGDLVFMSNVCAIHDKNNNPIEGGADLDIGFLSSYCNHGVPSTDINMFLNFSPSDTVIMPQLYVTKFPPIGYEIRFFSLSQKDKKVLNIQKISIDSLKPDYLEATKHSNGKDWWVVVNDYYWRTAYSILVTEKGAQKVVKTNFKIAGKRDSGQGQACFSPDGSKYIRSDEKNDMYVYDFDRCTGSLNNEKIIENKSKGGLATTGVCVSPNNRFLYQNFSDTLYQFDFQAIDLEKSRMLIDTFDGFYDGAFPVTFYLMERGYDGRIFMATKGTKYLHYINKPNEKGMACDFKQHGIMLTTYSANMPNQPNYRLGSSSVICTTATEDVSGMPLRIYPNPAQDVLHIESETGEAIQHIEVCNSIGEVVYVADNQGVEILLNTDTFANGMYILRVQYQNLRLSTEKFMVLR